MANKNRVRKHTLKTGFTLIELLVVIAIIAILAALLFPVFSVAREKARRNSCTSNLQKIGAAIELYNKDDGGYPPDLWTSGASSPSTAWRSGLLLLLGKDSPGVTLAAVLPADQTFLKTQPAYLGTIEDLHCPDDQDTDYTDVATTSSIPSDDFYDNYDGIDGWALNDGPTSAGCGSITPNPVSVRKYSLVRLPADDCGNGSNPKDYNNPDYTRQLQFTHPDSDTVVTWCTAHRRLINGIPTPMNGKDDLVLFLDGKVAPKLFQGFSNAGPAAHPVLGNGLRSETAP